MQADTALTRPDPRSAALQPYRGITTFRHPQLDVVAELRVSALGHPAYNVAMFGDLVTLCIATGCANIQAYATVAQARQLAHQLTCAADAIDLAAAQRGVDVQEEALAP